MDLTDWLDANNRPLSLFAVTWSFYPPSHKEIRVKLIPALLGRVRSRRNSDKLGIWQSQWQHQRNSGAVFCSRFCRVVLSQNKKIFEVARPNRTMGTALHNVAYTDVNCFRDMCTRIIERLSYMDIRATHQTNTSSTSLMSMIVRNSSSSSIKIAFWDFSSSWNLSKTRIGMSNVPVRSELVYLMRNRGPRLNRTATCRARNGLDGHVWTSV